MKDNCFSLSIIAAAVLVSNYVNAASEGASTQLQPITVEAEQTTEQTNLGSSQKEIEASQIDAQLARDLDDLLRYEPGVDASQDSRFGISGVTIRGLDGNRVKISVDGVDQADGYAPTSTYLRTGRNALDIDALQAVQIEKGGNVTAGSGAFGGSVRYETKDPDNYLNPEGNDTYGAFKLGYKSASNELSKTVTAANRTGKLESLLVYTRRDGNEGENYYGDAGSDQTTGATRQSVDPSEQDSDNILVKSIYNINPANRIGVVAEHYHQSFNADLYSESSDSTMRRADDDRERQRFGIFQDYEQATPISDKLTWQLDYQVTKTTNRTDIESTSLREVDRYYEEKALSLSTDLVKNIGNHRLGYGFNLANKSLDNLSEDTSNSTSRFSPKADVNMAGIYLEDTWKITDRLTLVPGARYDSYSYSTDGDDLSDDYADSNTEKLTGQLAAEFALTERTSLFGKYGTGFRAPKLDELYYYYNSGRGYAIIPNPDLKPEESTFTELGIRVEGQAGSAEVVAFYNDYTNFIESNYSLGATTSNPWGEYTTANLSDVVIKGVEAKGHLNLDSTLGQGWSAMGAMAYAEGEDKENNEPLASIAPFSLVAGLGYDAPSEVWGGQLNLTWVAKKSSSDLAESDQWLETSSYSLVDLTAYVKPLENVTINAGIFNAFDEKYVVWNDVRNLSDTSTNLNRYTRAGRNFGVDVTVSF